MCNRVSYYWALFKKKDEATGSEPLEGLTALSHVLWLNYLSRCGKHVSRPMGASGSNIIPHEQYTVRDLERQEISTRVDNVEVEDVMAMGRPTIQEVATELVEWIQRVLDPPLDPDDAEKIIQAKIDGGVFLECTDRTIFREAGLSVGAILSWPKVSPVQLSRVSNYLSYHIQSIRPS